MELVTALLADAALCMTAQNLAESLYETACALIRFCSKAERYSLHTALARSGLDCLSQIDGWTLPDAVWQALCRRSPHLGYYPCGEIAERAVKKTVVTLTWHSPEMDPSTGEHVLQGNLRRSLKTCKREGVLKALLQHYVFELCMDQLRRSHGHRLHFPRLGRTLSADSEWKLRENILGGCEKKAEQMLGSLLTSTQEQSAACVERCLKSELETVLERPLPSPSEKRKSRKPFVNVIVGPRPMAQLKSYSVDADAIRLLLHTPRPNVSFKYDHIEGALGHPLHSLVQDLIDIGVTVYMADQMVKRAPHLGRQLGILMPVRHLDIWNNARTELARVVSFLGRDQVSFYFVRRKGKRARFKFVPTAGRQCICLLSGGMDSAAGAAWVLEQGLEPIFVSHCSHPQTASLQKKLVKELTKVYDHDLKHVQVFVARARKKKKSRNSLPQSPDSPMTQFLRSFLFLCLASAVALESGTNKIYICENGPIALNPMFSEARVNTRTTHPQLIACFQSLVYKVFGVELAIENPFLYLTKGETASYLAKPGLESLVARTNSCWNWFQVPIRVPKMGKTGFKGRHDGDCLPCIIRRAALDHAGLEDVDVDYLMDVFTQFTDLRIGTRTLIADYLRFGQYIRSLAGADLVLYAPDLSVCAKGVEPQRLVEMYQKHAREVSDCFCNWCDSATLEILGPLL